MAYRRRRLREKRSNLAIPLLIIAIMVLSVIGYSLLQGNQNNVKRYNGFKFVRVADNQWVTEFDNIELRFYFSPEEVQDIKHQSFTSLPYHTYLTSNPTADYSQQDLMAIEVGKFELKNILFGLGYTPMINFSDTISCANSSSALGVIDLDIANETAIDVQGNCIKIKGRNGPEVIRARDKFLMLLLGILE